MAKYLLIIFVLSIVWVPPGFSRDLQPDWKHVGKLEKLDGKKINISDSSYKLSSRVKFFSTSGKYVTGYNFEKGDRVVVSLNDEGVVEGVWLVDEEPP